MRGSRVSFTGSRGLPPLGLRGPQRGVRGPQAERGPRRALAALLQLRLDTVGRAAPERHCRSTLSSAVVDCHPFGIRTAIVLPLLSLPAKMTITPKGGPLPSARDDRLWGVTRAPRPAAGCLRTRTTPTSPATTTTARRAKSSSSTRGCSCSWGASSCSWPSTGSCTRTTTPCSRSSPVRHPGPQRPAKPCSASQQVPAPPR